jgi:Tol biopolymer transport system component
MKRTVRIKLAAVLAVVLAVLGYSRVQRHGESPAVEKQTSNATEETSTDETGDGGVQTAEGQPVVSGGGRPASGASRRRQGSSTTKGSQSAKSLPEGTIPRGFEIAFNGHCGEPSRNWDICLMNADGSDLRKLREGPAEEPEWSPDASFIAFTDNHRFGGDIHLMNYDGSSLQNLRARGSSPSWSPDGGWLAFNRECDAQFGGPCQEPDGSKKDCGPECGIGVVSRDGTGVRRLGNGISPDWGPDGRIVFSDGTCNARPTLGYGPGGLQCTFPIWVMNPDGSGRTRLPVHEAISPTWSQDGRRIAYYTETGVFIANSDGTGIVKVAPEGYVDPSWSPDGRWLAVTGWTVTHQEICGGCHNIYLRGIDGSSERRLTSSNNDVFPAFSPRG